MEILRVFQSEIEARMAAGVLESAGIRVHINGSRSYASHITGALEGRYELRVEQANIEAASQILQSKAHENMKSNVIEGQAQKDQMTSMDTNRYLLQSLFHIVLAALALPLVANFFSLKCLSQYQKGETQIFKRVSWSIAIYFANAFTLYLFYLIYIRNTGGQ